MRGWLPSRTSHTSPHCLWTITRRYTRKKHLFTDFSKLSLGDYSTFPECRCWMVPFSFPESRDLLEVLVVFLLIVRSSTGLDVSVDFRPESRIFFDVLTNRKQLATRKLKLSTNLPQKLPQGVLGSTYTRRGLLRTTRSTKTTSLRESRENRENR